MNINFFFIISIKCFNNAIENIITLFLINLVKSFNLLITSYTPLFPLLQIKPSELDSISINQSSLVGMNFGILQILNIDFSSIIPNIAVSTFAHVSPHPWRSSYSLTYCILYSKRFRNCVIAGNY